MKDGLFGDVLEKVYRDSKGYLWILGVNGVARYDGSSIKNFFINTDKTQRIRELYNVISEDKNGKIWIGGNTGLHHFKRDTNSFAALDLGGTWRVSFIGNYDDKHIWVSCYGGHNFLVDINAKTVKKQEEKFTVLSSVNSAKGANWCVTVGGKILKDYRNVYLDYKKHTNDLCFTSNGNLYLATNNGLFFLSASDFKAQNNNFKRISTIDGQQVNLNRVATVHYFNNSIWIGTQNGMSQIILDETELLKSVKTYYNHPYSDFSLPSNVVNDIFSDNEGILWVATYGGLGKIDYSKQWFYSFQKNPEEDNSLHDNSIFSINGDHKGNMFFGSNFGMSHYNTITKKFTWYDQRNSSLTSNNIYSIYTDLGGQTWISVKGNLFLWNNKHIDTVQIIDENNQPVSYQNLYAIIQHRDKSYWMGIGDKVIKMHKISERVFKVSKVLETEPFQAICFYIDVYNRIWAGGNKGIMLIDVEKENAIYRYDIKNQSVFRRNAFQAIQGDSKGNLWLGSVNGLYKKQNDSVFKSDPAKIRFEGFFEEDGLANNYITGLLPGKNGVMWLSSWKGIMKYDPENVSRYHYTSYNYSDGLVSEKFYRHGAFLDTVSGTYYFGGVNGVNYFKHKREGTINKPPKVLFNELLVDGNNVKIQQELKTEGDSSMVYQIKRTGAIKNLFVRFSSSSLLSPEHQVFEWKLEGRDKEYTSTKEREIVINDIGSGNYVLKVRAASNQQQIGPDSVIEIEIEYAFVNIAKMGVPALLIIAIIYFLRLKRNREEQSKERYSNSNLTEVQQTELVDRLHQIMEQQKPYLRSDFKASELAKLMEISTVKLSQILNDSLQTKFYDFINQYRVNDFIRRLENNEDKSMTLMGIAELCGFSSKSTFYRAFSRFKGMTPSQFAKNIKDQNKK